MPTARTIITDALRSLRVLGVGDELAAEDANEALDRLNDWIDSLALEHLTVFHVLRTVKTLAAGTESYTIGTGGDIDIVRPVKIDAASLILDSSADPVYEKPIELFTDQRWQSIRQKDLDSPYITGIWFDHSWTDALGRIELWPVPDIGSTQLVLYTPEALREFATLDTLYTFPPGYRRFFRTNLAAELAPEYGKTLTSDQVHQAQFSKGVIKRGNVRPVEARVDEALIKGIDYFDWRTGESR